MEELVIRESNELVKKYAGFINPEIGIAVVRCDEKFYYVNRMPNDEDALNEPQPDTFESVAIDFLRQGGDKIIKLTESDIGKPPFKELRERMDFEFILPNIDLYVGLFFSTDLNEVEHIGLKLENVLNKKANADEIILEALLKLNFDGTITLRDTFQSSCPKLFSILKEVGKRKESGGAKKISEGLLQRIKRVLSSL